MEQNTLWDAFLSYASEDSEFADDLYRCLRVLGYRIFYDKKEIRPGDSIPVAIERGLENSRRHLLLISQHAISSNWESLERQTVIFRDPTKQDRLFVPIMIEDVQASLPDALRRYVMVDASHGLSNDVLAQLQIALGSPSSLQWSDSWILVALLTAKIGQFVSLSELITRADFVNRARITRGELEAGFARLVPLGHVMIGSGGYAASRELQEFWANNTYPGGRMDKFWDELAKHVGASLDHVRHPEVDTENFVSKADYAAATRLHPVLAFILGMLLLLTSICKAIQAVLQSPAFMFRTLLSLMPVKCEVNQSHNISVGTVGFFSAVITFLSLLFLKVLPDKFAIPCALLAAVGAVASPLLCLAGVVENGNKRLALIGLVISMISTASFCGALYWGVLLA